ncbi:MAG TPA: 50S ribosome-binding GTPase, partial [Saprospiraceae bacterium]|nr:50S ribosome-binding GTPase [Saprospiraceae bacterium]
MPEYAFIGRSNVGKSSLVNMLSGKTHIAKVSNTPG